MTRIPKEIILRYRYPDPVLKEKYKILNYILITLVGIFIIARIFMYRTIFVELVTSGFSGSALQTVGGIIFLMNTLILVLMIWVIKLLFSYDARAYLGLAILSLLGLPNTIETFDIVGFVLIIITLILSLTLKKKLFPNIPLSSYVPKQQINRDNSYENEI